MANSCMKKRNMSMPGSPACFAAHSSSPSINNSCFSDKDTAGAVSVSLIISLLFLQGGIFDCGVIIIPGRGGSGVQARSRDFRDKTHVGRAA